MMQKLADFLVRNRDKLPAWCGRFFIYLANNPSSPLGRVVTALLGSKKKVLNTLVPNTLFRVYIGNANYAAQGYKWARALEKQDPDVGARNVELKIPGGFNFPADLSVPFAVLQSNHEWAQKEFAAAKTFSHVIIEAQKPLFGTLFAGDVAAEAAALQDAGVQVALLCHGTDIRNPREHRKLTKWSPYPDDPRTPQLQELAEKNQQLLQRLQLPVFVSTPDLLLDVPGATWCPVVADIQAFSNDREILTGTGTKPKIVHAASIPVQKGSNLIAPVLEKLTAENLVDYQLLTNTPWAQMPAAYRDADIVLDQFRGGCYGVAACEAMAAGSVVVGHVLPQVRELIRDTYQLELPIIEATPDNLEQVLCDLLADHERMRELAAAGKEYVAKLHAGSASAAALLSWIKPQAG